MAPCNEGARLYASSGRVGLTPCHLQRPSASTCKHRIIKRTINWNLVPISCDKQTAASKCVTRSHVTYGPNPNAQLCLSPSAMPVPPRPVLSCRAPTLDSSRPLGCSNRCHQEGALGSCCSRACSPNSALSAKTVVQQSAHKV